MKTYSIPDLIDAIDRPARDGCMKLLNDNNKLFRTVPGSSHNHQAWKGGYWDHVSEVMSIAYHLYGLFQYRISQLSPEETFSLSDALLVLFVHDLEKPWRIKLGPKGEIIYDALGKMAINPELKDKYCRKAFVQKKLQEYKIRLTPQQQLGLKYIEGIRDEDYSPNDRVMSPLSAFCHVCDLLSARLFYDFPLRRS